MKYSDSLKGLKKSPIDIDEKMQFAYVNYELGNYVKSANIYEEIAKQSKENGKLIKYAVAKFNLSKLYILIKNTYWGENNQPKLLDILKSINVLDIYTECKTEHNKSILDWVLNIRFFTSAKQGIQNSVDRIRDHFYIQQNSGWASNNHIWDLIASYAQLETFVNGNYIIYNNFSEYQELTHTFIEGLFLSYSMKENQSSKLQDFDDWLIQRMIFNGKAEIILKHINRLHIKELKYKNTSEDSGLVSLILNHLNEVDEIQQSIKSNCEKGNSSFASTYNRIFSNLMLMVSLCTIDILDIHHISKKLLRYLKRSSLIDRTNFKYVKIFIANKGEYFEVETLKSLLFLQFDNDETHRLNICKDVIVCLYKKGALRFSKEELEVLISFAFNKCDSCGHTHDNDFIFKLYALTDDDSIKNVIKNYVKNILSDSFDKDFYYMALLYDILDTTDENFEKFVKCSKPIKNSYRGSIFGEETYCTQPQINKLLNVCFKHNLDLKSSIFNEYNDLENYYEWLFDIEDFNYENFNPFWVTTYRTKYYYMYFKKHPKVVEKLLAYLKGNDSVEISQAVADILNAD